MKNKADENPLPPNPHGDTRAKEPPDESQSEAKAAATDELWSDIKLFPDQFGEPCAIIPVSNPSPHDEFVRFRDAGFKKHLFRRYRDACGGIPKPTNWREMRGLMELRADEMKRRAVHNRFARDERVVWIDLCDQLYRRVRIGRDGWKVMSGSGLVFERHNHQEALPEPVGGGSIAEFVNHISARGDPDDHPAAFDDAELLTLAWVMSAVLQIGPTPILVLSSPKGSRKSTRASWIRGLLDPSKAPLQGEQTRRDLPLTLWHNAVPTFDNLTKLTKTDSDTFCRAVSGTGQDRRKLYTDADQFVFKFRRPIIMTAIGMPSLEPDFIDRCVVLQGNRLEKFRGERALEAEFALARPRLFGAILDLVVKVMNLLATEPESSEFRMADFAMCGRATARALDLPADSFDGAYGRMLGDLTHSLIEGSDVAQAVITLANRGEWKGNATDMLAELSKIGGVMGLSMSSPDWPRNAQKLSESLRTLDDSLFAAGVRVEPLQRKSWSRPWRIRRISEHDRK